MRFTPTRCAASARWDGPGPTGASGAPKSLSTMTRSFPSTLCALALLGLTVSACSPVVATRGNLTDPELVNQVKPGVSRREDVAALLGTPTSIGTFDENRWYYIGQRTEQTAFFQPEVAERRVVIVSFDDQGTVGEVKELDKTSGQQIEMVDRATPTAGRELGFLEQIVGNVGRFSTGQENKGPGR